MVRFRGGVAHYLTRRYVTNQITWVSMKIDQLDINKVRILESLGSNDFKTGLEIERHCKLSSNIRDIKYTYADTKLEFLSSLDALVNDAEEDDGILLFIEVHGNYQGIGVDGDTVPWFKLNEYLSKINEKSCLGLVVVFSCCYGVYYYQQTRILQQAPYYVMFGVDKSIYPTDLLRANKIIVDGLCSNDALDAIEAKCNSTLNSLGLNLTSLDSNILFHNTFEQFLKEAVDEDILTLRFSKLLPTFRQQNPGVLATDKEIENEYMKEILSKEYMETKFFQHKDTFLLTDKYFHLHARFTCDFDNIYNRAGIEQQHKALLSKYS